MNPDTRESLAVVQRIVKAKPTVAEGLRRLAAFCHVKQPDPVWGRILTLDTGSDVTALRSWLTGVLREEPPAPAINALWFGLYNPVLRNGRETSALYLSGSTRFSPADRTSDWAGWEPEAYLPAGRYAKSELLAAAFTLANEAGARELGETVLCLGYACLAVQEICSTMESKLLLGRRMGRAVAVGFDEGDFVLVRALDVLG